MLHIVEARRRAYFYVGDSHTGVRGFFVRCYAARACAFIGWAIKRVRDGERFHSVNASETMWVCARGERGGRATDLDVVGRTMAC